MKTRIGFGGSCHWCTEAIFDSLIGVDKVLQGWISSSNNNEVFSEAVIVQYDNKIIELETLIEVHLHTHSCTANHSMREKYRSAIYYYDDEQKVQIIKSLAHFQKDFTKKIITQVIPFIDFKLNIEDQLNYYQKNPDKPFCQNIINPKLKIIIQKFSKVINNKKIKHLNKSSIGLGTAAIGRPIYINIKNTKENKIQNFNIESFKDEGEKFLEQAKRLGVNHFDSSPGYGIAEDILINLIQKGSLNNVTISTKWGYTYVANFDSNAKIHEEKNHSLNKLLEQWEKSKQLLPYLDVYQIHSVTPESEVLDNVEILGKLYLIKKENNIEIGLSTSGSNQIEVLKKALHIKINNEPLFTSFQVTFNVLDQSLLEIKEKIKDKKIIIKEALANGRILSEKFQNYNNLQYEISKLAEKYKVTKDAIAIRFCMDCFSGSIVLSGANNVSHLKQNLKANDFELEKNEIEKLMSFAVNPLDYWEERKNLKWN